MTAQVLRDTADQFVNLGLRDAGYEFVNTDDGWNTAKRDADGDLVPQPLFGGDIEHLQASCDA